MILASSAADVVKHSYACVVHLLADRADAGIVDSVFPRGDSAVFFHAVCTKRLGSRELQATFLASEAELHGQPILTIAGSMLSIKGGFVLTELSH